VSGTRTTPGDADIAEAVVATVATVAAAPDPGAIADPGDPRGDDAVNAVT